MRTIIFEKPYITATESLFLWVFSGLSIGFFILFVTAPTPNLSALIGSGAVAAATIVARFYASWHLRLNTKKTLYVDQSEIGWLTTAQSHATDPVPLAGILKLVEVMDDGEIEVNIELNRGKEIRIPRWILARAQERDALYRHFRTYLPHVAIIRQNAD